MAGGSRKGTSFLQGELTQVDVAAIEKQLKDLWQHATAGDEGSVMRACSSNFIMLTDSDEDAVDEILNDILTQHPSRAILAVFKNDDQAQVDAWVSARCRLADAKGDEKVCSEQITVHASGASTEQLASVIRPLIVSDLPVVLWWRKTKLEKELLRPLASMADMLIVDSNSDPLDHEFLTQVHPMTAGRSRLQALDLNWIRLNSWQRAMANAFDGYPLEVFELANIESVTIHYHNKEDGRVSNQALLLAGWIAGRLQWLTPKGVGNSKLVFNDNGVERIIEFVCDKQVADAVHADVVELAASLTDQRSLSVKPEVEGEGGAMVARLYAGKKLESETTPTKLNVTEAQLVIQQMESQGSDTVFSESLKLAMEFSQHLK